MVRPQMKAFFQPMPTVWGDTAEWKPLQIDTLRVPWCSTNIILLMASGVTNTHGQVNWPTSKVWYTHPDHTPDVVSLQLTLLRIRSRFQWTSDPSPSTQGKLMSSGKNADQAAGWLTFGIKIFKTPTLRELCMHSSKTSKSLCIHSPSTLAVIIKFTMWVSIANTVKPASVWLHTM